MPEYAKSPRQTADSKATTSAPQDHLAQPAPLAFGSLSVDSILFLQRQIGNQATQRVVTQQRLQQSPRQLIQRVDFKNPDWSTAGSIKRSGEGAEGVVFVTFSDGQLIVKFIDQPAPATFAEQMLDVVGIDRPQTRNVPNDDSDAEGKAIRALIQGKIESVTDKGHRAKLTSQLQTRKWIQIQTVAQATSGAKLNAKQKAAVLKDAQVMQDLGRLAVTDAFLGNYDRISQSSINTGNFMIADGEGPSLIAIDNDADAKKGTRGTDLKYIMQPDKVDMLAQMFVSKLTGNWINLPEGVTQDDIPALITTVSGHLKIGIKDGSEKIIAAIQSDKKFFDKMKAMEKGELAGPTNVPRVLLRAEMKDRFKLLQDGYKKGGWDKITAET